MTGRRIGIAFGGGGARGLSHLGVFQRLMERGISIHCVAGTSIGAIMGAVVASNSIDRAIRWCADPDWKKLPRIFFEPHLTSKALIRGDRIGDLLGELIPARTFGELIMPFAAVATDLHSGERVVIREGDLLSAVRASMSVPGVFRPVERDGRILIDGGLVDPVPVLACRELGADTVIAVDVNPPESAEGRKSFEQMNMVDVLLDTFRIFNCEMTRRVLSECRPDILVRPNVGSVKLLDFRNANRLVELGRQAVDALDF